MSSFDVLLSGIGIGVVFGLFGAGGSAFATPVLALLGVPGVVAVASPLPAMLPAALAGARPYLRSGNFDRRLAALTVAGGFPGTLLGAAASSLVPEGVLLALSGLVLGLVGVRLLSGAGATAAGAERCKQVPVVLAGTFAVGLLTGLLANGGGFLLVPLFVLVLGVSTSVASGTSLVAVGVLTVPTVVAHAALGHIDWAVAIPFALGAVPGSVLGGTVAQRVDAERMRRLFGALLVGFSVWFMADRVLAAVLS